MKSKHLLIIILSLMAGIADAQVKVSTVFGSEAQNAMAAKIPGLLLEAYRNGHIKAYYPAQPNQVIPYAQFLQHFGEGTKAQQVIATGPDWFCGDQEMPKASKEVLDCLSQQFEIGERLVENRVTRMNELKQEFIRLIFPSECHPAAIDTYGPVFKINDLRKIIGKAYRIPNPENDAISYSIEDVMRLRLFKARTRIGR